MLISDVNVWDCRWKGALFRRSDLVSSCSSESMNLTPIQILITCLYSSLFSSLFSLFCVEFSLKQVLFREDDHSSCYKSKQVLSLLQQIVVSLPGNSTGNNKLFSYVQFADVGRS